VHFLKHNPEVSITVYPMQYGEKEKEYIQFFEAKKKYFLSSRSNNTRFLSKEDSVKVEMMSIKDASFVHYLNNKVHDPMIFTIQEKCNKLVGSARINSKFKQLNLERKEAFISQFKKSAVENRVKILADENKIPYNGFSFYKIIYKGELPRSLIRAYKQMNELNNEAPRKLFKAERINNRSIK